MKTQFTELRQKITQSPTLQAMFKDSCETRIKYHPDWTPFQIEEDVLRSWTAISQSMASPRRKIKGQILLIAPPEFEKLVNDFKKEHGIY